MSFYRKVVRIYKLPLSILIFALCFSLFHLYKPGFAYLENGAYRPFGVGYKHKTVVPVWLVSICLATLSYLFILSIITWT